jgi:signal transduction histidine kinase/DNA-binding response OmpR family regulator
MADEIRTNILIVDDRPDKVLVLCSVLEELGQNLVTALSGREALRRALERDFAVILLDVNMPDMDGFETAALLRQRRQSSLTPIIFVTAYWDDTHAGKGYSLGAVDYIYAPVVPEVLRTKVSVFVELYRKTEQVRLQAEERVALVQEQALRAAAEEASRRSAFLAQVSAALAGSLDFEATLATLCRALVPYLADLAAVTATPGPQKPRCHETAWVQPDNGKVLTHPAAATPDDPLRQPLDQVLDSAKMVFLKQIDLAYPLSACGEKPAGRLSSALLLPLLARGRALGVLTLGLGASGRAFTAEDLALAEDIANRAAIALDNARLYRDLQEADRRKNEFLAMLAHELRNPLAPIRNAVEILRLLGPIAPALESPRCMIERQVEHLVRLVDELLDVSRITGGKVRLKSEPLNLMNVVSRALETSHPLIDERRHKLSVTPPPRPLWVEGDLVRLAQVLANLLNNAAKYTEPGGRIWLTVGEDDSQAVLRVRDSGMGIPADMLGSIFELFTQVDPSLDRSHGGLGIGLTLAKQLVELHGGRVEAHSEGRNRGSEFLVRLPLTAAPIDCIGQPVDMPAHAAATLRILVVDDNVDSAQSLHLLLGIHGHQTRVAHSGGDALASAADFEPHVVLLDIGLPGMDGYEVARRLRALPGGERMILVATTGYGHSEDRRRSRAATFDCHLVKPIDLDELNSIFSRLARHDSQPIAGCGVPPKNGENSCQPLDRRQVGI